LKDGEEEGKVINMKSKQRSDRVLQWVLRERRVLKTNREEEEG